MAKIHALGAIDKRARRRRDLYKKISRIRNYVLHPNAPISEVNDKTSSKSSSALDHEIVTFRKISNYPQNIEEKVYKKALKIKNSALYPTVSTSQVNCDTLSNPSSTVDPENAALQIIARYPPNIQDIVEAMERNLFRPKVLERACNTIRIMANNEENRRGICYAHAIPVIVKGMEIHQNVPLVQVYACAALQKLTFIDPQNFITVTDDTNTVTVIRGRNEHEEFECFCLENYVNFSRINTKLLVITGGIRTILNAMKHHSEDISVQSYACSALTCFTVCVEYLEIMRRENPQYLLENAANRFPLYCKAVANQILERLNNI